MDGARGNVSFDFTLEDNVTPVAERMGQSQERLASKTKATNEELDRQRIRNIDTLASLNAFRGGIGAMTTSMRTLGLVDEDTYQTLRQVTAGITMVSATAETLKGAIGIMRALQAATKGYAIASVFASIAANPVIGAVAVAGAGIAAYGALTYLNKEERSSVAQNVDQSRTINFYSAPDRQQRTASASLTTGSYY